MSATVIRLLRSWLFGILVGTGIIAVTSPLFVRSYLPLRVDAVRQVWTLPPGQAYRWRSEGYATTSIGPLGMPGKQGPLPGEAPSPPPDSWRVALWGDSQAEGVCVADPDKLFAIAERLGAERLGAERLQVFPLARSGEDAADWVTQMAAVEQALDLDFHVILTVDLEDLLAATEAPLPPPSDADVAAARGSIAATLPAFVIQAARHLLTEADEATPRRLQFSIGPHVEDATLGSVNASATVVGTAEDGGTDQQADPWREAMQAMRAASSLPILILDAPVTPQIVDGRVVNLSENDPEFRRMKGAAEEAGLLVVSARTALAQAARDGRWPHGFHNGRFGSGHLNRSGNAVVASLLVAAVTEQSTESFGGTSDGGN